MPEAQYRDDGHSTEEQESQYRNRDDRPQAAPSRRGTRHRLDDRGRCRRGSHGAARRGRRRNRRNRRRNCSRGRRRDREKWDRRSGLRGNSSGGRDGTERYRGKSDRQASTRPLCPNRGVSVDWPSYGVCLNIGKRRFDDGQCIRELARGGEALVAVAIEPAREHRLQRGAAGDTIEIRRVEVLIARVMNDVLVRRRGFEGRPAGQHLVQHDSERVDVGAAVDALAVGEKAEMIGRGVTKLAHEHAGLRHGHVRLGRFGHAQVDDLDELRPVAGLCDHQIFRADVAMHDAGAMNGVKARKRLDGYSHRLLRRQGPTAAHQLGEVISLDELPDHVVRAVRKR